MTLNPRVDFAFKKLFGSEENKDCLISLINSIVSELEYPHLDEAERMLYEGQLKWLRDQASRIDQVWTEALEEGIEKGRAEGRAEGIEKGLLQKSEAVAQALLKENMSIEKIAKITGLTVEAIEALKN